MIDYTAARRVAAMLAAVAEPTRLRILEQLAAGPRHVGALADALGVPMVNMSHHLGVMRQNGILEDEKDGRRVIYRIHPDVAAEPDADSLTALDLAGFRLLVRRTAGKPAKKKG